MIPTTMTVDAIFTGAQGVVLGYFGALLLAAVIIVAAIWAVKFVPRLLTGAIHGRASAGGGKKRRKRR